MFAFDHDRATGIIRCRSNRFLSVDALQVVRTLASERMRTFQSEADALAWLAVERPRRRAA